MSQTSEDRPTISKRDRESNESVGELKAALARAEARYEALVGRAGYGIYRSSVDGRFVEANATLAAMLGYASVDDLFALDLKHDVYLDPEERGRIMRGPAAARGYPDWIETRWKRRDGSPITVPLAVRATLD